MPFKDEGGTRRVALGGGLEKRFQVPGPPGGPLVVLNAQGKFLWRGQIPQRQGGLGPGEKKIETMSLPRGPRDVAFYEIRQLD